MTKHLHILLVLPLVALMAGCGNMEKNPDARDEKNPMVRKALEQIEAQQFGDALQTLEAALDKKPDLARADLEAARIYHMDPENRDLPRAIYHYERYLEKRPDTNKTELIKKWIHQAQLNFAAETLRSNPNDFMAEVNRLKRENAALRRQVEQYTSATNQAPAATEDPQLTQPAPQVAAAPQPQAEPKPEPKPAPRTYTVQRGDTLSNISRKVYGTSAKWRTIYEANRSKMKSERDLKIGQDLIIPQLGDDEKPRG